MRRRKMCKLQLAAPVLGALLLAPTFHAMAQAISSASTSSHGQLAPLSTLYRLFAAYQVHLDRVASDVEKRGRDGSDFRDHLQRQLGFTPSQYAMVRRASVDLDSAVRQENAKMQAVIKSVRAQYPNGRLSGPEALPPVPPELTRLKKEREEITQREIAQLQKQLGPILGAKLDHFITTKFAGNVVATPIGLPRAHDILQHLHSQTVQESR